MKSTVRQIAAALDLSVRQVQRDIKAGCPCASQGSVGRGRGTLLDLDTYRQWRAAYRGSDALAFLEEILYDCYIAGITEQTDIHPPQLALVFVRLYEIAYERLRHEPLLDPPEKLRRLCRIVLDSLQRGDFRQRRNQ